MANALGVKPVGGPDHTCGIQRMHKMGDDAVRLFSPVDLAKRGQRSISGRDSSAPAVKFTGQQKLHELTKACNLGSGRDIVRCRPG